MSKYRLLSVLGLEIEYMLVDKNTLEILPISDRILEVLAGKIVNEFCLGDVSVSNELVLHVIELKNAVPKPPTFDFKTAFQDAIKAITPVLDEFGAMLLPSGSHPFMDPDKETKRWPHGQNEIYSAYDRIFNCKGHGWSNLQSVHLNLAFNGEAEFCKLHNIIRLILPLLPALCASSPYIGGVATGVLDNRLVFYSQNQKKIPQISGQVIPEFIQSFRDYQTSILEPMYQAIAPFDSEGILQEPWLNSRGGIPKFDVGAIEIRIIDSQECVKADVAIAELIYQLCLSLMQVDDRYLKEGVIFKDLVEVYTNAVTQGLHAKVSSMAYLEQLGLPKKQTTLNDVLSMLIASVSTQLTHATQSTLEYILSHGNLSERLLKRGGTNPSRKTLVNLYQMMGQCLQGNQQLGDL